MQFPFTSRLKDLRAIDADDWIEYCAVSRESLTRMLQIEATGGVVKVVAIGCEWGWYDIELPNGDIVHELSGFHLKDLPKVEDKQ